MSALARFGESLFPYLVDTVWQATALMLVALALARLIGKKSLVAQYCLRLYCVIGLLLLPIIRFIAGEPRFPILPAKVRVGITANVPGPSGALPSPTHGSHVSKAPGEASASKVGNAASPGEIPADVHSATSGVRTGSVPEVSPIGAPSVAQRPGEKPVAGAGSGTRWRAAISLVWLAGCSVLLLRLLFAMLSMIWVCRVSSQPSSALAELFEQVKKSADIGAGTKLRIGRRLSLPVSIGIFRPIILLPKSLVQEMSPEQLRPVLLHELAHVRWKDYTFNVLQRLAQAIFFFHPLVHLMNRRLSVVREQICDNWTLTHFSDTAAYAKLLTTIAEKWLVRRRNLVGVGLFYHWDPLSKRIERILSSARPLPARLHFRTGLALLAVSLLTVGVLSRTSVSARSEEVKKVGPLSERSSAKAEETPENNPDTPEQEGPHRGAAGAPAASPRSGVSLRLVRKEGGDYVSVSPDGKYLCDWDGGNLAVYHLGTGSKRLVVEGRSDGIVELSSSAISSDSKSVAYLWWNSKESRYELHLTGLDGIGHRVLHPFEMPVGFRVDAWAPDGKRILGTISGNGEGTQLVWASVDDGSIRLIQRFDDSPERPHVSPDGRYIAYDLPQAEDTQKGDIFVLSLGGNVQVPVAQHPANDKLLAWTPDGKHIFFASDRMGTWDGWLQSIDRGKPRGTPRLIRPNLGEITGLAFTPVGSYFYAVERAMFDVYTARLDPATGEVVDPPKPLRQVGKDTSPDWSPDGKYLAYRSHLPRWRDAIRIRSLETGEERVLDGEVGRLSSLRWTPDGQSILVSDRLKGGGEIYLIDVESSNRRVVLTRERGRPGQAQLSPDGKTLFYSVSRGWLFSRELETGVQVELFRAEVPGTMLWSYALSPDGERLMLHVRQRGRGDSLQLMPAAGGPPKELFSAGGGQRLGTPVWMPDGKSLLFEKDFHLWQISVKGGEPHMLWEHGKNFFGLRVHPDGQRIVFGKRDDSREVWIMENFLPEDASAPKPPPGLTLRRVRQDAGSYVSISQDGRYLCDRDLDTYNLIVRDLATGNVRQLSHEGLYADPWAYALGSAISPDSKTVAYAWCEANKTGYGLQVIGLDGSGHRVVRGVRPGEYLRPADWSPDCKQILVDISSKEKGIELAWVSAEDGSTQAVKTLGNHSPAKVDLSPDGRHVAYDLGQDDDPSQRDIFALRISEKREIALVRHPADDRLLGWTPDGQHILFASDRMGSWDAWLLQVADGNPRGMPRLAKRNLGEPSAVGFAATGSYYFCLWREISDVFIGELDPGTAKILSPPNPLRHVGKDDCPDWSPDGKYLAYRSAARHAKEQFIHIRTVETGEERVLDATELKGFRKLRWWPDGKSILVTDIRRGAQGPLIYQIDAQTGDHTILLRSDRGWVHQAEPSPDGKALFYSGIIGQSSVFRRELETGSEKEVSQPTGSWALSPDGQWLATGARERSDWTLKLIPSGGGEPKELLRFGEKPAGYGYVRDWSPDGQALLFSRGKELWRISAKGGQPEKLWESEKWFGGLRVHPDGRRIAFHAWDNAKEVWVMENFLPAVEASAPSK